MMCSVGTKACRRSGLAHESSSLYCSSLASTTLEGDESVHAVPLAGVIDPCQCAVLLVGGLEHKS